MHAAVWWPLTLKVTVSPLLREAYPTCEVSTITLVYNVTKLMYLDKER